MSRAVIWHYRWAILAFVAIQAFILCLPASPTTTNWAIVWGYGVAAAFALCARAPLAFIVALSVVVVRSLLALGIVGIEFRAASMIFADLFFLLVIVEVEYHRALRRLDRSLGEPS